MLEYREPGSLGRKSPPNHRVVAAVTTTALAEGKPVRLKGLERQVRRQLNQYRRKNGRKALKVQKQLLRAAVVHGKAMAMRGFFEHESANGESFDTRVKRYSEISRAANSYGDGFASARIVEAILTEEFKRREAGKSAALTSSLDRVGARSTSAHASDEDASFDDGLIVS